MTTASFPRPGVPEWIVLAGLLSVIGGCEPQVTESDSPLFERRSAAETGIQFANKITEDQALNAITFEYMYNGAGVGVGDLVGDSLPDLFFASNMGNNVLYRNDGDFQFTNVTKQAGIDTEGKWANGVTMVDINHDGHLDIYVSVGGPLYRSRAPSK
jgi:hypothetical protein